MVKAADLRRELKLYMERTGKSEIDVASVTKVDPKTVSRFLSGETKTPRRIVRLAFEDLLHKEPEPAEKTA